ncbi:uroplakin-3b-like protein 1 [Apteryx rowi]|uniref:uroplakin-3b-like protein 1 n=1 Tax=Apteryx rowi TaxID=308060 RepID=UPI000E1D8265|nr:uroplakin-3b-like protein 1 [Apteryx rowi]
MLPLLLLLATAPGARGLSDIDYVPTLTNRTLGGRTTASTFVLEQPRCVFGDAQRGAQIWLVVALAAAADRFDAGAAPGTPQLAFQTFPSNTAYATLGTALANYPCPPRPGDITVLRVGSETACRDDPERPSCNGPLPGPGPYRVKFVAWNQSGPQAETQWSEPITLKIAQQADNLPVMAGGRSTGMIVLTSLLSILFAILLACLVALLATWSSDSCGSGVIFSKPDTVTVKRYNTHHVYDQPAARL